MWKPRYLRGLYETAAFDSGGSSNPQGTTQIVQNRDPWQAQQEPIKFGFEQARANYDSASPEYFPGSTVVPFSNQTNTALGRMENRAMSGSPLVSGAQNQVQNTLRGDYLNAGNPYFSQMADIVRANVQPSIDARFAASGRSGSGLANRALGQGLGDAIGGLAYQNYAAERQNQLGAAQAAPAMAQLDYVDPQMLQQIGGMYEGQAGANLQDQIRRFNFEQNKPDEKLRQYMTLVGGGQYGGSSTSEQPIYASGGNSLATGLGAAGTLAGIAGTLFGKNTGIFS
jgi:hypothetical protein